jgi:hypothetical protein
VKECLNVHISAVPYRGNFRYRAWAAFWGFREASRRRLSEINLRACFGDSTDRRFNQSQLCRREVDATLGRLGKVCKDKLMTKFKGVPMSDLHVTVGATLKESLDSGSMTLKDLQKSGASFNIEVPGKGSGYCNVNGKGKIDEFSFNK